MPPKKKAKSGGGGQQKSWDKSFEILKEWFLGPNEGREYGYNDIPAKELGIEGFVKDHRSFAMYNRKRCSDMKKQKLASISWPEPVKKKKSTWEENFEILKEWYHGPNQGHEYVYNDIPVKELDIQSFVRKSRSFARYNELSEEKKQKLASISWPAPRSSPFMEWEERYSDLVSFKMANGHFTIPSHGPHRSLHYWLCDQNDLSSSGKLSEDRCSRLEAIGFKFTKRVVVEGIDLGYFKPDEADRAEAEAKTILSALGDPRQMSEEAVSYRLIFRLANDQHWSREQSSEQKWHRPQT